ncbi:MAG TPA: nucleoside phosphorylase [Candidatus Limnocylindria bacterium]|jgi:uridine phosphorylase|nr:nucleoside phosphorylase [Candidatus Limnocylindria bacterium]
MATDPSPDGRQYHLRAGPGQIGGYVLLPGDPDRADLIARSLDDPVAVATNREFRTWTGMIFGERVSVTSTGIGGPSAAIAVSELTRLGAHTFIRVGSCGSLQPRITPGHLVIATGAVRDEGTGRQYIPIEFPAFAHHAVVSVLERSARESGQSFTSGIVYCKDALIAAYPPDDVPLSELLMLRTRAWVKAGVVASEMESAIIFVLAALKGRRAGSILRVLGPGEGDDPGLFARVIDVAISAVRHLIAADRGSR